ncbi:unnamed protein product [marine sediment metagenome]|uniref:DUF8180 domain-containing protein n=1 Tax=marine sediment metagenome TaxID=412755 RepID=X1N8P6_9ZZZZ
MASDERGKLKTLLNYWIEHNKEHSQEFREWSDKVKELGEPEASQDIAEAVVEMDKVSEILTRALDKLGGKEG